MMTTKIIGNLVKFCMSSGRARGATCQVLHDRLPNLVFLNCQICAVTVSDPGSEPYRALPAANETGAGCSYLS